MQDIYTFPPEDKPTKVKIGKTEAYTEEGLSKAWCGPCSVKDKKVRPSSQWRSCAINKYIPVCEACDVALNLYVTKFLGIEDYKKVVSKYAKSIGYLKKVC